MTIVDEAPGQAGPGFSSHRSALLSALYGACEPSYWFMISSYPDKRCRAFQTNAAGIAEAADYIDSIDKGALNIFTSMAYFAEPPQSGRGTAADVAGLVAFWADVDVGKVGYANTLGEALAFIDTIPVPPSITTCSGIGAHSFWLWTEPLTMEKPDERADALDLLKQWKVTIRELARRSGVQVDAGTFDPARVMRISGTWNPKSRPPAQAYIIQSNDRTYNPSDIEPILLDAPELWDSGKVAPINMASISVAPLAERPEAFNAAMSADQRLRRTWARDRKDLDDQSASAYSLSLTDQLVSIGLTDAQIVGLVYEWRREQGAVEKPESWYARTIGLARQRSGMTSGIATLVEAVQSGAEQSSAPMLDGVSQIIGIRIEAIRRYGGQKRCTYRIMVGGQERELGNSADLLSSKRWAELMADFGHSMPSIKASAWNQATVLILKAAEDVDVDDELTEAGDAAAWVNAYIDDRDVHEVAPQDAWEGRKPWWKDGRIAIWSRHLLAYVNRNSRKEKEAGRDFFPAMRALGAERKRHDLRSGRSGAKVESFWLLPLGYGGRTQGA